MRALISELGTFTRAMWSHWGGKVSGGFGAIYTTMQVAGWMQSPTLNRLFLVAAALFFIVAAFAAWRTEHRARVEAQAGLHDSSAERARIDYLEMQLSKLRTLTPRRLSEEQVSKLVEALKLQTGSVSIASDDTVHDARGLAKDLADAFKIAGWTAMSNRVTHLRVPAPTGIAVEVMKASDPVPTETTIARALSAASLRFDLRDRTLGWTGNERPEALIIVTYREP
jgi:hypothetical protein